MPLLEDILFIKAFYHLLKPYNCKKKKNKEKTYETTTHTHALRKYI